MLANMLLLLLILGCRHTQSVDLDNWGEKFRYHDIDGASDWGERFRYHDIEASDSSDQVAIINDLKLGLSAFKDDTVHVCFVSPLIPEAIQISKFELRRPPNLETLSQTTNIVLETTGRVDEVTETYGGAIAAHCANLPVYQTKQVKKSVSPRRQKRAWASSSSVTVNADGDVVTCKDTQTGETATSGCGTSVSRPSVSTTIDETKGRGRGNSHGRGRGRHGRRRGRKGNRGTEDDQPSITQESGKEANDSEEEVVDTIFWW